MKKDKMNDVIKRKVLDLEEIERQKKIDDLYEVLDMMVKSILKYDLEKFLMLLWRIWNKIEAKIWVDSIFLDVIKKYEKEEKK